MRMFCCVLVACLGLLALAPPAEAHGWGSRWGGVYVPYYRGAPFYSHMTGDYGFTHGGYRGWSGFGSGYGFGGYGGYSQPSFYGGYAPAYGGYGYGYPGGGYGGFSFGMGWGHHHGRCGW